MRHQKKKKFHGRKRNQNYLIKSLAVSLILKEKIITTSARAKALINYLSPLIRKAKINSLSSRRYLQTILFNKKVIEKLLIEIGPRYKNHQESYFYYTKIGHRQGDNAPKIKIEFI